MDKTQPPRSFGVFKPTGYTVIAFASEQEADAAFEALLQRGFDPHATVRYTPAEMQAQVRSDLQTASPFAAVGQELNLVRAHGDLAAAGAHFIVAPTSDTQSLEKVREILSLGGVLAAQRYGAFIIEDLVGDARGNTQSFESPDRGLDLDTQPDAPEVR